MHRHIASPVDAGFPRNSPARPVAPGPLDPPGPRVTPFVRRLDGNASPCDVLRELAAQRFPLALVGRWAGGSAVVTCNPVLVADGPDPLDRLASMPVLTGPAPHSRAVLGGWFGHLGYDVGRIRNLRGFPPATEAARSSWLGFYDCLLRWDSGEGCWYVEAMDIPTRARTGQPTQGPPRQPTQGPTEGQTEGQTEGTDTIEWRRTVLTDALAAAGRVAPSRARLRAVRLPDLGRHVAAVERAQVAIRRGELFQVNVCTRVEATLEGSAADLWAAAAERLRPAWAAYVTTRSGAVASLSPELFLRRRGRQVTTMPIKGTTPRTGSPQDAAQDVAQADVLRASVKDVAENVMIVDLMRNDLGRLCEPGTVRAGPLVEVQPHPGVWHLVSQVTGTLRDGVGDDQLLAATLPPGSVTGAPKIRSLELIEELEASARGAYCGTVGFVSPVWGGEWNVAIRTLQVRGNAVRLGVGGGITAESTPVEEWAECRVKAEPVLTACGSPATIWPAPGLGARRSDPAVGLFETLLVRQGKVVDLAAHLGRLRRAFIHLYAEEPPAQLGEWITAAAAECAFPLARLRIDVPTTAKARISVTACEGPIPLDTQPGLDAALAVADGGLERFKFADRRFLEDAERRHADVDAVIFADERGCLLEGSREALFAVDAGALRCPPLDGRILASTTRERILELAGDLNVPVRIGEVSLKSLPTLDGAFLANSLHGIRWIRTAGGGRWHAPAPLTRLLGDALSHAWRK